MRRCRRNRAATQDQDRSWLPLRIRVSHRAARSHATLNPIRVTLDLMCARGPTCRPMVRPAADLSSNAKSLGEQIRDQSPVQTLDGSCGRSTRLLFKIQDATLATTKLSKTWCNRLPRRQARLRYPANSIDFRSSGQRLTSKTARAEVGHRPREQVFFLRANHPRSVGQTAASPRVPGQRGNRKSYPLVELRQGPVGQALVTAKKRRGSRYSAAKKCHRAGRLPLEFRRLVRTARPCGSSIALDFTAAGHFRKCQHRQGADSSAAQPPEWLAADPARAGAASRKNGSGQIKSTA